MLKNIKSLFAVMAIVGLAASPALADHHKEGGKDHKKGEQHFNETDTNGDGYLTIDEMLAKHKERLEKKFETLDADGDGKVSKDEMKSGMKEMRAKMKERWKERKEQKESDSE